MRKLASALLLAVIICVPAFGASRAEMKRMSTFLSNFTELGMYDINADTITDGELVHFGVWHNYVNNFKSRIRRCPDKNCPYGSLIIDEKYAAESVKKFFNINLKHTSTEDEHYSGNFYHFEGADGEITYYAEVQEVSRKGSIITMRGELYSAEDDEDRPATFTARAKPYKYGGKDTWYILSLAVRWRYR
ncbi:MAG: hypothetical protein IJS28_10070 [Synergistaceae bacterium]|nr:hypothetical protein [Synergistaceae bacterium]